MHPDRDMGVNERSAMRALRRAPREESHPPALALRSVPLRPSGEGV